MVGYADAVYQLIEKLGRAVGSLEPLSARDPLITVCCPAVSDAATSTITQLQVPKTGFKSLNPLLGVTIVCPIVIVKSFGTRLPEVSL